MSRSAALENFVTAVNASPEHAARLAAISADRTGWGDVIALAGELGCPLTTADLAAATEPEAGELNEAALAGVAGGVVLHGPAGQRVIDWSAVLAKFDPDRK